MKSHLWSHLELLAAAACCASLLACGGSDSSSSDDPGSPASPTADGTNPSDQPDAGASPVPTEGPTDFETDGGASSDGGPKPPALPVVGTVTGFANVSTRAYRDLACTPSDCYGASDTQIEKIANGATAPSATPALPFTGTFGIANVAVAGPLVYAMVSHSVYPNTLTNLVVLSGGAWTLVGATTSVIPDGSLATDGKRVYAGLQPYAGGGAQSIAVGASPTDAWTQLPFAPVGQGSFTALDAKGTLFSTLGASGTLYRRLVGDSAWSLVEKAAANANPYTVGRKLTVAATGDVWFTGLTPAQAAYVAKVPAGGSSWVPITLPAGHNSASQIVVDGSNTAYFTLGTVGMPQKLMKLAPGSTTAIDTGVTVALGKACGPAAIDASGKLLFNCNSGSTAGAGGTFRSTP